MNDQEKQIEPFKNESVNNIFKKVGRKNIIRNIIISATVALIILFGGYIANKAWMGEKGWDGVAAIEILQPFMEPDTYIAQRQVQYGFLGGTLKINRYKIIKEHVIPWSSNTLEYGAIGGLSGLVGDHGNVQLFDANGNSRFYNAENGQQIMLFYHPTLRYTNYFNDISKLDELPDNKYIEMAISFDKAYSLTDVQKFLPDIVEPTWYWINSYAQEDLKIKGTDFPEQEGFIYGFRAYEVSGPGQKVNTTEESFIKGLNELKSYKKKFNGNVFEKLDKVVQQNQRNGLIIGVVVTGTKDQLKSLNGLPFVKASTFGAMVNKY
ncbi:hypothetical protein GC102_31415 [Paenibacillus sp. LMG 31460]|uniref:Sigma factor regulator C-terminal domain-containing protein n=1 Tax=Paenibacillus germinis TaxID=2654979 RepID=A0ABX1ZA24_9BACL|nr:anti-sigma factor C-terminal domain-containing protein [Paenibacillus germinis]NOU90220.1 hypothetical protein [Paenibacillus germinis]